MESLRVGVVVSGIPMVVRKIGRYEALGATAEQPSVWTVLEFEVEDVDAERLANVLMDALDKPGWYADFHDEREIFVVFPGRVFRYPRGDDPRRAEAQAYGRELGIPEPQLDWTV